MVRTKNKDILFGEKERQEASSVAVRSIVGTLSPVNNEGLYQG